MPESVEIGKTATSQEADLSLEYTRLEEARQKIYKKLNSGRISRAAKIFLVARIFENSVEDGEDIADFLGMGRTERISFLTRKEFIEKNPDFSRRLADRLSEYDSFGDDRNDVVGLMMDLRPQVMAPKGLMLKTPKLSEGALALMEEIDDYYDQFRKTRKLKEVGGEFDSRSRAEKMAESVLEREKRLLTPHYYTGPIKDFLGNSGEVELRMDLIDQETLEKIFAKKGITLNDERVTGLLTKARYKPLDLVYTTQKETAEEELKKEIKTSIRARGYKEGEFELQLDPVTNKYKVLTKRKEKSQEHVLERKNLKLVDSFEAESIIDLDLPEWSELKEACEDEIRRRGANKKKAREIREAYSQIRTLVRFVDGVEYKIMHASDVLSHGYIIFPDGTRSQLVQSLESFEISKVDGELRYPYRDKTGEIIINYGGKELKGSKFGYAVRVAKSKGNLHQIVACESFDINDHSKNPLTHTFDLKINGKTQRSFVGDYVEMSEAEIEGDLVYVVHSQNMTNEDYLYRGDQVFGPYRNICLDHESKDELIFCGINKGGSSFVYFGGKEHQLKVQSVPNEIRKIGDKIYIQWGKLLSKDLFITDELGNMASDIYETQVGIEDAPPGKLCYLGTDRNGEEELFYDGKKIGDFSDSEYVKPGVFKDRFVGIVRDKKQKVSITNFEDEKITLPSLRRKKPRLRIEIANESISIAFVDPKGQYRVYRYAEDFSLTDEETEKLQLLNTMQASTLSDIEKYFGERHEKKKKVRPVDKLRDLYSFSQGFAGKMTELLQTSPEIFRGNIAGKRTQDTNRTVDSVISSIFPSITTNLMRSRSSDQKEHRSSFGGKSYLGRDGYRKEFIDGDPREMFSIDLIHLREPMAEFLSTGMYGECEKGGKYWESVGFPISEVVIGPTKEITAELNITGEQGRISLPKCLNSRIIPERIKGIRRNGKEVVLKGKVNALGEVTVEAPDNINKILYSQTVQELPVVPEDISHSEYEHFRTNYERSFGNGITEKLIKIPEDWKLFLQSIKNLKPVEQLVAIEEFVKEIGYYDFENKQMQPHKEGKGLADLIIEMSERAKELKRRSPADQMKLQGKKYAGVCSDFAKVSVILLREAGFIAGIAAGFQPKGTDTVVTSKQSHGVAYVLWPAENDKAKVISIDGTPAGMNETEEGFLSGIRQKSLAERLRIFNQMKEKVMINAETYLAELEELVANLDEEGIKQLQNGKLEQFLNVILSRVKDSNLAVVQNVLNASRYGGINFTSILEKEDLGAQIAFRKFLESEVKRERANLKENNYFKGEELLRTIEDFVNRYSKDRDVRGKKKATDIVEKVVEMASKYLDPIETKSVAAIITYLRAKKMQ